MSKNVFLKGAMILTIAGILVKVIGAVNRIVLSRMLGGEGIGLYQLAYPIYILALSFLAAGIPIAISILIAEKRAVQDTAGARKVFLVSLRLFSVLGVIAAVGFYGVAHVILTVGLVQDERAYWALLAVAPALFFGMIMGCFRGYFQGYQLMTPTAISQVVDQAFRVIAMMGFAWLLLPWGLEYAAAGAAFGAVPGTIGGLCALMWSYRVYHKFLEGNHPIKRRSVFAPESSFHIAKRLLQLMVPVAMANIMMPAVASIDLFVVPNRLVVAGYSVEEATTLFGYLTGMATSLVNLPAIFTAALAAAIVPAVSKAFAERNFTELYRNSTIAMRLMNMITMPMAVGIAIFGVPISLMLYATPHAGGAIGIMAWGIWLLGVQQVSAAILQGMGHTSVPLVNMVISAMVKIALSWKLTAIHEIGILGAAWSTNVDLAIAALLNVYFLYRYSGYRLPLGEVLRLGVLSLGMGGVSWLVYQGMWAYTGANTLSLLVAIGCGGVVYSIGLLLGRFLVPEEWEQVPKVGPAIATVVRRLKK